MRRKAGVAESNDPATRARMTGPCSRSAEDRKLGSILASGHPPPFARHGSPSFITLGENAGNAGNAPQALTLISGISAISANQSRSRA